MSLNFTVACWPEVSMAGQGALDITIFRKKKFVVNIDGTRSC